MSKLASISNNESSVLSTLSKDRKFGTDGIRGPVTSTMNPLFVTKLGWAAGSILIEEGISKVFIGKDILHVSLFNSDIKEKTYNLIYRDGKNGTSFMKRFKISGVIRDKEYNLTQGKEGSEVLYFSSNIKGIADVVTIHLRKRSSIKKIKWEVDFGDLAIKGRDSKGNIVTKYTIRKVSYREKNSIEKIIKKIDEIEVNDEEQISDNSKENQTKLNF